MCIKAEPVKKVTWTLAEALLLAEELESMAVKHGFHVALTGGLLYKSGPRKDADFVMYAVRGNAPADIELRKSRLYDAISSLKSIRDATDYGFVTKFVKTNKQPFDILWPDIGDDGSYSGCEEDG